MAADGTVAAQVTSQTPTDPWAKAGVMLRATSDPGSPYYAAFVTPGNGVAVQWRTAQGGSSSQVAAAGTVPTYLQIGRYTSGGTVYYTAYTSPNGTTWTAVPGSTQTVAGLTGTLLAGLAVTSHDQGTSSTVGFNTVSVTATEYPPPGFGLPDRLDLLGHRGPPSPRPADADRLDLVDQRWWWRHLGDIRLLPLRQPDLGRRRHSGRPGDLPDPHRPVGQGRRHAPGHLGPGLPVLCGLRDARQRSGRPVADGPGGLNIAGAAAGTVPTYLQIGRYTSGSTVYYTAYTSPNGTTWTAVPGSTQTVAGLTGTLLAGLAVTSHDQGTSSTVGFNTVSVTATEYPPPGYAMVAVTPSNGTVFQSGFDSSVIAGSSYSFPNAWLENWVTTVAAAGDTDVTAKLLKGDQAGDNKTFKTHLDGYNQMPYFKSEVENSPRHESFYFSDNVDLLTPITHAAA